MFRLCYNIWINNIVSNIKNYLINLDVKNYIEINDSKSKIFVFTFHSIHEKIDESLLSDYLDPNSSILIDTLERIILVFLENNVRFITSNDILKNNIISPLNVIFSFDDGYYNNHHLVDISLSAPLRSDSLSRPPFTNPYKIILSRMI